MSTKTFRGRSLDELLPQVKQELGEDAVILDRRETLDGGVGGFFQRRVVELEVASGAQARAFQAELARAQAEVEGDLDGPEAHEPGPPPAPAHRPHVDARVTDVTVDDLFSNPRQDAGLASLFAAGHEAQPIEAGQPEAEAEQEPRTEGTVPPVREEPVAEAREPVAEPDLAEARTEGTVPPVQQAPEADVVPWHPEPVADAVAEVPEPEHRVPPVPVTPTPPPAVASPDRWQPPQLGAPDLGPEAEVEVSGPHAAEAEALAAALTARGVSPAIAADVVAEALERLAPLRPDASLRDLVGAALARRIPVARLGAGPRVIAFAGSGGTGKTSLVAGIVAAHAAAGRHVAALALRAPDGGAELGRLLAPAAVPVHPVGQGSAAAQYGQGALAVLDTPGASPRDAESLRALAADLRAAGAAEIHLTLPATTGADAARELLRATGDVGVTAIAVTHADETEQLGTAIGLAIETGVPLSLVGRAPGGERLEVADAAELAEALLP